MTAPANTKLAPPGHYMLFILGANGAPSVASIVKLVQPFTDDPLMGGTSITPGTPIRAVHVAELRTRIDDVRAAFGLGGYPYSDPMLLPTSTTIRAQHIIDLREALRSAYVAAKQSPPTYSTNPTAGARIVVADIQEIREWVKPIE